ncbi:MAG: hypothetical protein IPM53_32180 [Anaerolineaceae bacterium]|nr:hypothetical protein [Anaerolineaceae bacterium]
MDDKLKEAIAAVRTGNKREAQQQLTALLDEDPTQVQGWYLLSLLVDSPQKQAAYLSKTLALNPHHEKAKEQLALLEESGQMTPTASLVSDQPMDVLAQSETDMLPEWLVSESGDLVATPAVQKVSETAVPNDTLPDWLKEPAVPDSTPTPAEAVTIVSKTAVTATQTGKGKAAKPAPPKPVRKSRQNTQGLNIILGLLVSLAVIVIILLAYLLLS